MEVSEILELANGRVGLASYLAEQKAEITEIKTFINNFIKTLEEGTIEEKITFAGKVAEDKEKVVLRLNYLEGYLNRKLFGGGQKEYLKTVSLLFKIAKSREYIRKNVNNRLIIESLLLRGV
jgi:hypothetical protein